MNDPLFSILVANYNNGHFFKDCYHSIIEQTYANWEVIIVDDGSTDDSVLIIKKLIEGDSRFKLFLNEENEGCGFTKNKCVSLAEGIICGFLDPDDTLEPDAIALMIEAHLKREECSIITSKYFKVSLDLKKEGIAQHGESIPLNKSYLTFGKGALTHFATFKRANYLKTEGINPLFKRAVDQDLYFKLEEVGRHFYLDRPLYNYRIHSNSISANYNVYKAQYWHYKAIKDAYFRRNKNRLIIDNIETNDFKIYSSNYYYERYLRIKLNGKKKTQLYFILISIKEYPGYLIKKKIKELIKVIIK